MFQEGVIMQVKVAGSMPKRRVSFEERYFIEPMEVVLSRCVCVKEKTKISSSVIDVFQVNKSQLGKFPHLTRPNSECGEMKTYEASSSLGRPYFNFRCT